MTKLYKFYKSNILTDRYKGIFWERGDIKNMSPEEFKKYVDEIKKEDSYTYFDVIQRFTERGFITEAVYFFDLEDINFVLNNAN